MALNIKNREVERLASEVAELSRETKTEAIRQALAERRGRLSFRVDRQRRIDSFLRYLEEEIRPQIPSSKLGRKLTRQEEEEILGFGEDGV